MPKRFDAEMTQLKKRLLGMGAIAEDMIAETIAALVHRDEARLEKVRVEEERLDLLQREIDDETVRMIAVYTPVASDLRLCLMATRINAELERIGDRAISICKGCGRLFAEPPLKPLVDLPRMAEIAQGMVRNVLTAFVEGNADAALAVIAKDDEVDNLNDQIVRELITYMLTDAKNIQRALSLIFISRAFERIGDHAVNIAEDVVYVVRGEDIRHKHA